MRNRKLVAGMAQWYN